MHAILEIASARERVARLSVEEYRRLAEFNTDGKRTELIRGIIFEKISKSPLHATIASRLLQQLLPIVPEGWCIRAENPLTLTDSEPEPDLAIVQGDINDFLHEHPHSASLVIEIAVSSYAEDQQKALLYAEANIAEYWIVLPHTRTVEVYHRPANGRYWAMQIYGADHSLTAISIPQLTISLATLFSGLPG